jgi:Yip1 domain
MESLNSTSFGNEPTAAADPGPGSLFAVLYAPVKTFMGLAARPRILLPLLVLIVLSGISGTVLISKIDPDEQRTQMREQFEKQGMAGAQLEESVDRASGFMAKFGFVLGLFGSVMVAVLALLFAALLLGGLKLAGASELGFRQALSITVHAWMPVGVLSLLTIPVALGRQTVSMAEANSGNILMSNLGFLATEQTSNVMRALLGSADVFSLWTVALTTIGGAVIGRVSRGAAFVVALVLWILGVLLRVGGAMLQG